VSSDTPRLSKKLYQELTMITNTSDNPQQPIHCKEVTMKAAAC